MKLHFLVGLVALAAASRAFAADDRPNVLFIAVDDLRVELGCYGETPALTPNVDRLAKRGTLFQRAYCQQALCNPSRASLLTGRRPDTLRIWDLPTHLRERMPDVVTLPEHFKKHGYHTRCIGKVFHNWRQKIEGDPQSWSVPSVMHYNTHGADTARAEEGEKLPRNLASHPRVECRDVPDDAYFDGRIAKLAVRELRRQSKQEEPFFLAVGYWKPHLPFNAPKKYWDLYDRTLLKPPADPDPPRNVPQIALHDGREVFRAKKELTEADVLELRHGYYAAISYFDAQVGKLLDALDRTGLADNTIVVFWSDHGFHLGEHGLWAKTSCFELDARVPLVIARPGEQTGQTSTALVELLDLYPTLVELAGLPMPDSLEGSSLVPILTGRSNSVKPAAYTQHPRPAYYTGKPKAMGCSVRTDRFRYTEWRDFSTGEVVARELYDHETDPGETRNIAANPPIVELRDEAAAALERVFPRRGYIE